jgi:hypothetical protein
MARNEDKKRRAGRGGPRRTATRRPGTHLAVVPDGTADGAAGATVDGAQAGGAGIPVDVPVDDRSQRHPPPELAAAVAHSVIGSVAHARTPLEAELVVSEVLGTVELGVVGGEDDAAEAVSVLMTSVVEHAERIGTADALATLRVCAALGPTGCRALATEAAGRVAAAGVAERPWAARLGRPDVLRAWRYGDVFGEQESFGVLFTDRGRDHALMILVDHGLGGGVKDAWVAEGRQARGVRDRVMAGLADEPTAVFEDIDVRTAAQLLRDALECPPCPVQDDQVEDVATHLVLARARAERHADLVGLPPSAAADAGEDEQPGAAPADVLTLKVSLRGLRPPVWRRLEVPASITLERLHLVLQAAFGWSDAHLHSFEAPSSAGLGRRGSRILDGPVLHRTRLGSLVASPGDQLLYVYDFGDDWEHLIELEARGPADPTRRYPRCTGGRRAAPPEDCGGVPGFAAVLDALADPANPDHADTLAWVPPGYDPARFDRAALDAALTGAG